MDIDGKTVCIIGATGGIGREVTTAFAKRHANLILTSRKMESLLTLKKEVGGGDDMGLFTCDISDSKSIDKLAMELKRKYKKIDILFHLAGIGVYKDLPDISIEEWNDSININATSVFYIIQKLLPLLKSSEKAYVLASGSGMGKVALSGRAAYCASKFALRGLMLSLAREYENTNINFVHLTLGSVLTPFGPLSLKSKKEKSKEGKGYLEPDWLANHIIAKLQNETFEDETPVYPPKYFSESKKDIR